MWVLASAVVTASLLGSMHCVGMCGPLAIWASGAGEGQRGRAMLAASGLYHLGRLVTYLLAGLVAGAAGQLADLGGEVLGVQLVAARIVGSLMVLFGILRLWQLTVPRRIGPTATESRPSGMTRVLLRLRPIIFRLPIPLRGLVTGLLTVLLPCGWLYLFALVAAGTGSLVAGPIVMAAFWLGSVPALIALVSGTQVLALRFRRSIPAVAALMLMLAGGYTASGRGLAELGSWNALAASEEALPVKGATAGTESSIENATQSVDRLTKTPLPCCAEHATNDEVDAADRGGTR